MTVYVGIDWGKDRSAFVFGRGEDELVRASVASRAGELLKMVKRIEGLAQGDRVVVAIEPGAPTTAQMLYDAGFVVHVVDGKQLKRYRESLTSSGTSNDEQCAFWAWQMVQSPAHLKTPYEPLSDDDGAFQLTLRALDWLSKDVTAAVNQLRSVLRDHVPDLEAEIASPKAGYARDLVRAIPTSWHAARFGEEDWEEFVACHCVPKKKRAALWAAIRETASRPQPGDHAAESVAVVVAELTTRLEDLLQRERRLEQQLRVLAESDATVETAESMPGIGVRTAAQLTAHALSSTQLERAARSRDPRDYVARRTLVAPVQDKTGTTRDVVRRRRGGSRVASVAAIRAAAQATMRIPWAKAMYAHRRAQGDAHYTALRKVARSLMRILTAMVRDHVPYDDAFYVERLKAKGVVWAASL